MSCQGKVPEKPVKPKSEEIETEPDAWDWFEKTVDTLARTPPKPRRGVLKSTDPTFIVVDEKMRVVRERQVNEDSSLTADVYRNLEDFRRGRVTEPDFVYWR